MKPGDVVETAIWLSGTETEEQLRHWQEVAIPATLRAAEKEHEVEIGPPTFVVKRPGEDRVPPVPGHISGPDVRLLVAEAKVGARKPRPSIVMQRSAFVHDLRPEDLARLRRITRRAYYRQHEIRLSDHECDRVIESLGPEVALKTLRNGTVH